MAGSQLVRTPFHTHCAIVSTSLDAVCYPSNLVLCWTQCSEPGFWPIMLWHSKRTVVLCMFVAIFRHWHLHARAHLSYSASDTSHASGSLGSSHCGDIWRAQSANVGKRGQSEQTVNLWQTLPSAYLLASRLPRVFYLYTTHNAIRHNGSVRQRVFTTTCAHDVHQVSTSHTRVSVRFLRAIFTYTHKVASIRGIYDNSARVSLTVHGSG